MGNFIIFVILGFIAIIAYLFWIYQQETKTDKLRGLLAQQKWFEANAETSKLCLFIVARQVRHQVAFNCDWNRRIYVTSKAIGIRRPISWIRKKLKTEFPREITSQDIEQFPCSILHEIDQLWIQYSNGHFGLSIQKQIYEKCLEELNQLSTEEKRIFIKNLDGYISGTLQKFLNDKEFPIIDKLNWYYNDPYNGGNVFTIRKLDNLIYSLNAPKGHLPVIEALDVDLIRVLKKIVIHKNSESINHRGCNPDIMISFWKRLKSCVC